MAGARGAGSMVPGEDWSTGAKLPRLAGGSGGSRRTRTTQKAPTTTVITPRAIGKPREPSSCMMAPQTNGPVDAPMPCSSSRPLVASSASDGGKRSCVCATASP